MQASAFKIESGSTFSPALCVCCDYTQKDRVKAIGGRWDPLNRRWELPYTAEIWQDIVMTIPGIRPDDAIRGDLTSDDSDLGTEIPSAPEMPLRAGVTPFRHQYEAYCLAVDLFEGGAARAG